MKKKEKKTSSNEDGKLVFYTHEIKKSKSINEDTVKIITFIIILIVVLGLFALLFFINGKYVTKDKYQDNNSTTTKVTEPAINLNQTIVDDMFNLDKKNTYYVLAYDSNDELGGQYLYNVSSSADLKDIEIYTLDLSNAMNKKYYNKEGKVNTKPTKASEVNFTTNTLIVFKKGKVAEYITDKAKILEKLTDK